MSPAEQERYRQSDRRDDRLGGNRIILRVGAIPILRRPMQPQQTSRDEKVIQSNMATLSDDKEPVGIGDAGFLPGRIGCAILAPLITAAISLNFWDERVRSLTLTLCQGYLDPSGFVPWRVRINQEGNARIPAPLKTGGAFGNF